MSEDSGRPLTEMGPEKSRGPRTLLQWVCALVGTAAAVVILWVLGLTVWSAMALLFLIACPLVVVWILVLQRRLKTRSGNGP
jgi:Flp pilus assembly protein TadB